MRGRHVVVVGALVGLAAIGFFLLTGIAIGFGFGRLAGSHESGLGAVPSVPRGLAWPRWHLFAPFLCGIRLLLPIGLFVLLLVFVSRWIRMCAWRATGGPWMDACHPKDWRKDRRWHRHGHWPHRPVPPWWWGWGEPPERDAEPQGGESEPDAESADFKAKE
jgi:hypothetical protein